MNLKKNHHEAGENHAKSTTLSLTSLHLLDQKTSKQPNLIDSASESKQPSSIIEPKSLETLNPMVTSEITVEGKHETQENAHEVEDSCCLDSTVWGDCSFFQEIDLSSIEGHPPNAKFVDVFNEKKVPISRSSGDHNLDGGNDKHVKDIVEAEPLDSIYYGEHNPDSSDQPVKDMTEAVPPKEIKIDVTPIFVTDEVSTKYIT